MDKSYQKFIDKLDPKILLALEIAKLHKFVPHVGSYDVVKIGGVIDIFSLLTGLPIDAFNEFFGQSHHPYKEGTVLESDVEYIESLYRRFSP